MAVDLTQYSYEELAHALYMKGEAAGYHKITDKTKWREAVIADKLNHIAYKKISAGKNSEKYGADATNPVSQKQGEYKTQAIDDNDLRNLLQQPKYNKKGTKYAPLKVSGVYNGAYTYEAIDSYEKHEHYFGVFYKELCVLIIKVETKEVTRQLREELVRREAKSKKGTTNCNTVKIGLNQKHLYEVAWRNDSWFDSLYQSTI